MRGTQSPWEQLMEHWLMQRPFKIGDIGNEKPNSSGYIKKLKEKERSKLITWTNCITKTEKNDELEMATEEDLERHMFIKGYY